MSVMSDVVIIGGGAIGAACARELSLTGRRVLVLDPGGAIGQAWRAAAGMLAPQIEAAEDDASFRFGLAARAHYPPLAAALHETTGLDIGLWREGIAQVARGESEATELEAKASWQQRAGQRCEWLPPDVVATRWPWLRPSYGALWADEEGALEPTKLVQALLADARRCGAVIVEDTAVAIEQRADRVTAVVGQRDRYAAGDVVLAAGAWSGRLGGLPRTIPVTPVRGQMAATPWPANVPRAIIYSKSGYIVARDQEAILGSTMEQAGFQADTTAEGIRNIIAGARTLFPLLPAAPTRTWAGLRPTTADGLPIIGPDPTLHGLWYATGHGRNGILLAGLTGALVAQLLNRAIAPAVIAAFSPARL